MHQQQEFYFILFFFARVCSSDFQHPIAAGN